MFEHLSELRYIYVIGPQRSGTRCIAHMIASDTGHEYIDEKEYAVDSLHALQRILNERKGAGTVVHGPGISAWAHALAEDIDGVVFCWRSLKHILRSQGRWWNERNDFLEAIKYGRTGGSAKMKQHYWETIQSSRVRNSFTVRYPEDVEHHPLFVKEELRVGWNFDTVGAK